jgi:hypothetical protein
MSAVPWIQTAAAVAFPLAAPLPEMVAWRDVATSLGRLARFNGHTIAFYSVAQHSLTVERLTAEFAGAGRWAELVLHALPSAALAEAVTLQRRCRGDDETLRRLRLAALLHDGHEAYLGDVATPVARELARRSGHDHLAEMKAAIDQAIHTAAGLPTPLPAAWRAVIAAADLVALATEKADLMAAGPDWGPLPDRAPWPTKCLPEHLASDAFLKRLIELLPCGES